MKQYQSTPKRTENTADIEAVKALLPSADPKIAEVERKIVTLYMMIEKVRRENVRLRSEVDELRDYIRSKR